MLGDVQWLCGQLDNLLLGSTTSVLWVLIDSTIPRVTNCTSPLVVAGVWWNYRKKRTTKQPLDFMWSRYPRGYIDCALQLQHFCVAYLSLAFWSSEGLNLRFLEVVVVSLLDIDIFDRHFLLQTPEYVLWRQIISFTWLHNCICLEHISLHTSRTAVVFLSFNEHFAW